MKSVLNFSVAALALFAAFTGQAMASPIFDLPEPGSIALVGLGLGVAVLALRKRKK